MSLIPKRPAGKRKLEGPTFEVNNQGLIEQWDSKKIEEKLGVGYQQVACLHSIGFEFEVGAEGRLVTAKGVKFDEEMHKRYKAAESGNCALSEK